MPAGYLIAELAALANEHNGRFSLTRSTGPGTHWVCRMQLPPGAIRETGFDVERYADDWAACVDAVWQAKQGAREAWQG